METKEALWQLNDVTRELNAMADDANKRIRATEAVLEKMGVGLEVVMDEPFMANHLRLAFARIEDHWCLVVWETDSESKVNMAPLLACPRLVRIQAVQHIDPLISKILATLTAQLNAARQVLGRGANGEQ